MKTTLTAIALLATITAANAYVPVGNSYPPHFGRSEGIQNYYHYFGANCCGRPGMMGRGLAPSYGMAVPPSCGSPCGPCCAPQYAPVEYEQVCSSPCDNGGLFGLGIFGIF